MEGRSRRGTNPGVGDAFAAVASAAGTGVGGAGAARRSPRARGSAGPVAMEDFIVISDDSGSESSAGTRSGRARRLRRALSRTPGALPRRTVVSESTAARYARREPRVAPSGPRRCDPSSPPPCLPAFGGLGPRGARRRRWQGRPPAGQR